MQPLLRRLAARATSALSPTASAWVVIGFVAWVLTRPFLPLQGALASLVDTVTALTVLLAAALIEASREVTAAAKSVDPQASGGPPPA